MLRSDPKCKHRVSSATNFADIAAGDDWLDYNPLVVPAS
jgi:hypothetical protein